MRGTYPDCETEGCDRAAEAAYYGGEENPAIPCDGCPLIDQTYLALVDEVSYPLYRRASLYLLDHELGLDRFWEDMDHRTIEAIRYVHGERARQAEARRAWKDGK